MSIAHYTDSEIQKYAFPAVIKAGKSFYNKRRKKKLQIVGKNTIVTFMGPPDFTTVISRDHKNNFQSTCTCGFSYGGVCEHVVAAMLSANDQQAIQVGLDFESVSPLIEHSTSLELEIDSQSTPGSCNELYTDSMTPVAYHQGGLDDTAESVEQIKTGKPGGRLYLTECDGLLLIELRFAYLNGLAEFSRRDLNNDKLVTAEDGRILQVFRSKARETIIRSNLLKYNVRQYSSSIYTPVEKALEWLRNDLPQVTADGFEVFGRENLTCYSVHESKPSLSVSAKPEGDTLQFNLDISFDGISANLSQLLAAIKSQSQFVKLADGSTGIIPQDWLDRFCELLTVCDMNKDSTALQVKKQHAAALDILDSIVLDTSWREILTKDNKRLETFDGVKTCPVPSLFRGELRPYQKAGFDWFQFLREFNLGGCLADDMGLGKTVQTLALLLSQKNSLNRNAPSLLVVPTSLIFNWERECKKFTPVLLMMRYHGPERKRYRIPDMKFADVIITTYGTVLRDSALFKQITFHYIILDEAQAIKNPLSTISKKIRDLKASYRLALSGTPIENSLSELWSLFTFLNPGMLGSFSWFNQNFIRPIEREKRKGVVKLLRKIINPSILRRTKQQVAKDLPPKTESVIHVSMASSQQMLYDITRDTYRSSISKSIDKIGLEQSRMIVLEGLLRLRQISCHPAIMDQHFSGDSGKFQYLESTLLELIATKHKVLIFSQFVSALNLLSKRFVQKKITYEMLTGKTRNRQVPVENFQSDENISVMLISLKAGGTGLNLTAADYVIHLDPWWNPAAENQASDRAYRIGQTRQVFVYKLITENSVEQRVLELQEAKQELFDSIINTESTPFKKLSKEDILNLFS